MILNMYLFSICFETIENETCVRLRRSETFQTFAVSKPLKSFLPETLHAFLGILQQTTLHWSFCDFPLLFFMSQSKDVTIHNTKYPANLEISRNIQKFKAQEECPFQLPHIIVSPAPGSHGLLLGRHQLHAVHSALRLQDRFQRDSHRSVLNQLVSTCFDARLLSQCAGGLQRYRCF